MTRLRSGSPHGTAGSSSGSAKKLHAGEAGGQEGPRRRPQRRALETRDALLAAALSEFAERGYDAASIRSIGLRTGLQHPLITYHFRTKEILWRAVAENAFAEIRRLWDEGEKSALEGVPAIERLRGEYATFLRFTVDHPDFHHFMLRENRPGNPRLPWLVETILLPTLERVLPQIRAAQAEGDLPVGDPTLIHYMLIGMTSVLSSLRDEISLTAGLDIGSRAIIDSYLQLLDGFVFRQSGTHEPD